MDLRQLRYFVAAAEEQNFRRAAERLHIVQSALSRQIALLEADLGCALFLRRNQRVTLSPVAELFLTDARRILDEVDQAVDRLRQAANGRLGRLRIGLRETASRSPAVSRALGDFRAAYPDVELIMRQMASPMQCDAVRAGELDAGFVYLSPDYDEGLTRLAVGEDHFYLAIQRSHPLATKRRLLLRDLVGMPFVLLPRATNIRQFDEFSRHCRKGGLTLRVMREADGFDTIYNLVSIGLAASFVINPGDYSPHPGVVLRRVEDLAETLTLAMVWRENDTSPLVGNLLDCATASLPGKVSQLPGARSDSTE